MRPGMVFAIAGILCAAVAAGAGGCTRSSPGSGPPPSRITVFAAASTIDVMKEAGARYEKAHGVQVVCSFDATSSLARQIKAGAPADVFLSADEQWMDDLAGPGGARGLLQQGSRQDLLLNQLVMIAPAGAGLKVQLERGLGAASQLPNVKRIAMGDPSHVPAGRYAKQALQFLGWWDSLQGSVIPAVDTRAALRLVEIGEADAGIVYATDAKASSKVEVAGVFPAESHDAIRYPIALCRGGPNRRDAERFLEFLRSPEMNAVFERAGFAVAEPQARPAETGPP